MHSFEKVNGHFIFSKRMSTYVVHAETNDNFYFTRSLVAQIEGELCTWHFHGPFDTYFVNIDERDYKNLAIGVGKHQVADEAYVDIDARKATITLKYGK